MFFFSFGKTEDNDLTNEYQVESNSQ